MECDVTIKRSLLVIIFSAIGYFTYSQDSLLWHNIPRQIHYKPEGEDFVLVNGKRRFNRALYGGNTAFRAEAGDLPEFALYLPGMGGNIQFGLVANGQSKWLTQADTIHTRYRPGSMMYQIKDRLLGKGSLQITVLALYQSEGLIIKMEGDHLGGQIELVAAYGGATDKKFSRDGDIGADPESSFYLQPEYCANNVYHINQNTFNIYFGSNKALTNAERNSLQQGGTAADTLAGLKTLWGLFPQNMKLHTADATQLLSPLQYKSSKAANAPALCGSGVLVNGTHYFLFQNKNRDTSVSYEQLSSIFNQAEQDRQTLANRIKVHTPDVYINTMGGALAIAADAIWEEPSYMHGAVAWRMRLPGWRGPYAADVLGWHNRARTHFDAYALSQVTEPATGPVVMDTALHLARGLEKMGTSMFSSGYISRNPGGDLRPHHYDMNLVYIDQLLNHFLWNGDTAYIRKMWPVLVRHLDWEKRNFDTDGDGLFDAYAAIWASDALQYSGGGVTHSSAYNYRSNKMAASLATLIGEDGTLYRKEAEKILQAMNRQLWLKKEGTFAEFKDLLGNQLLHSSPGLWTIYHAIDEGAADPFQAYQMTRYIDHDIPHIPIRATGLNDTSLYTLSTTNWQPYSWSLNNVALAELLHTSLAYWQAGRSEEAFRLWKSSLVESMYLGASPGNFQQLSFYDAIRGELYRDFADPIGMAARSLVEGLFGIEPNALKDTLFIHPGLPSAWQFATLQTPDILFRYRQEPNTETWWIEPTPGRTMNLSLTIPVKSTKITEVTINGIKMGYRLIPSAIGKPLLQVQFPKMTRYKIQVRWKGNDIDAAEQNMIVAPGQPVNIFLKNKKVLGLQNGQGALLKPVTNGSRISANTTSTPGNYTVFVKVRQGLVQWWQPLHIAVKQPAMVAGTMTPGKAATYKPIDLSSHFNDKVTRIFDHEYLSPRPLATTLQLPTQGIGNWAYPLVTANIKDSGTRRLAGTKNMIYTPANIPFSTPSDTLLNNVLFTSQWNNFPPQVTIPVNASASSIHLLMAGTTHAMQSRITNGRVIVQYTDAGSDTLLLKNPENWWPIEQDYYLDGFAFTAGGQVPGRLYLKEGKFSRGLPFYSTIKGFSKRAIEGGAATVLEMTLDKTKTIQSLTLQAVANDVIIGLMAATLEQ